MKKEQPNFKERTAVDQVFEKRRRVKMKFDFLKAKPLLFMVACFCGVVVVLMLMLLAPSAKVKVISVQGNNYLSDEYIQKISGVNKNDIFYFLMSSSIEKKIEKSEMIANATVFLEENNIVRIVIEEEAPIAYRYADAPEILLKNGELVAMNEEFLSMISRVPYLEGFNSEEQLKNLARAFKDVSPESIELISEINRYSLSYDTNTIQLLMMDGNYFFSSYFSMSVLNAYTQITSELQSEGTCIFADDGLQVAYTSDCPWTVVQEEREYWVDDLGNQMEDEYGDPIEKKYYVDSNGNYILDDSGNRIVVPIGADENDLSWIIEEENSNESNEKDD